MKVNGAVCVVTGATGGLGAATARRLLASGASVVLADVREPDASALAQMGGPARFVAADVRSESDMTAVLDEAERLGPIRALVHCPGRGHPKRLVSRSGEPFPLDEFQDVVALNLFGTFNAIRLSAARMSRNPPD